MTCPRFVVKSVEELEVLARAADPPIELGQRAELVRNNRIVLLEVTRVTPLVEWNEVRP